MTPQDNPSNDFEKHCCSGCGWLSFLIACIVGGSNSSFAAFFITLIIFFSLRSVFFRAHLKSEEQIRQLAREQQNIAKELQTKEQDLRVAEAYHAFKNAVFLKFDCRPCPRCGELQMWVKQMTPNGRSIEVRCCHCGSAFRWKAVHPDTSDAVSTYHSAVDAIKGTRHSLFISVPPNKFSDGGGREPIPDGVRQVVWRRDGGRCVQCGSETNLHFDHIIPVAKGGATVIENLQILCAPCNQSKGAKI